MPNGLYVQMAAFQLMSDYRLSKDYLLPVVYIVNTRDNNTLFACDINLRHTKDKTYDEVRTQMI
jgi:hypothetical protein